MTYKTDSDIPKVSKEIFIYTFFQEMHQALEGRSTDRKSKMECVIKGKVGTGVPQIVDL